MEAIKSIYGEEVFKQYMYKEVSYSILPEILGDVVYSYLSEIKMKDTCKPASLLWGAWRSCRWPAGCLTVRAALRWWPRWLSLPLAWLRWQGAG